MIEWFKINEALMVCPGAHCQQAGLVASTLVETEEAEEGVVKV